MENDSVIYENINSKDDDEKFVLAPWGCLNCAFKDFGLKLPKISRKMAEALWMISLKLWKCPAL